MNKEEVAMIGFEIVAYAGEARSQLIEALDLAEKGEFDKAESLVERSGVIAVLVVFESYERPIA